MDTTHNIHTTPAIPSFAQGKIDEVYMDEMRKAWESRSVRLAGKFSEKEYIQRSKTVNLAHIRHIIKETKKYNVTYSHIITMQDLALKCPEIKWEAMCAIMAMPVEFRMKHYSERGNANEVVRFANPEAVVEAPKEGEVEA